MITLKSPVWESGGRLPAEYQRVSFLRSNGDAVINTGIKGHSGLNVEMTFTAQDISGTQSLFGAIVNNAQRFNVAINSGKWEMQFWNDYGASNVSLAANTEYHLEVNFVANNGWLKVNGQTVQTRNGASNSGNTDWYLFARNSNGTANNKCKISIPVCKVKDNGVLVRDFVPCYRKSDYVAGMYDLVGQQLYTNIGTGNFVVGEPV